MGWRPLYRRFPERVLDGIPGFIAWLALLLSIASAVAFPLTLMLTAAAVALYSALRFLFAGVANGLGNRKVKTWEAIDWYQKYLKLRTKSASPGMMSITSSSFPITTKHWKFSAEP